MSELNPLSRFDNSVLQNDEGGLRPPPGLSAIGKAWWWFHILILVNLARLRFIAVLVAIGLVIAKWDLLSARFDKLTRPLLGRETAVSSDTEYWCPMDPGVVRDHPDMCPICHMPLSKRKKGEKHEGEALPPGVVSRVQLTPYKVAVAGIETVPLAYRPLTRDIHAIGFVEFNETTLAHIAMRQKGTGRIEKLFVNYTGQMVEHGEKLALVDLRYSQELMTTLNELRQARQSGDRKSEELARRRLRVFDVDDVQIQDYLKTGKVNSELTIVAPMHGHIIKKYQREGNFVENGTPLYDVADLSTVWIEAQVYEDDLPFVQDAVENKLPVTATTKAFPNRTFKGEIVFVHPHLDATTRTLMVRFNMDNPKHELRPGMYATVHFQVPITRAVALGSEADDERKTRFQKGEVLAVPERAVIDTGSHQFVYRETQPDIYEGVEVQLGPRCDDYYPVLAGLQAGDRVATTGSFLIDAETRLGTGASSTYYGAGGSRSEQSTVKTAARPSMTRADDAKIQAAIAKLSVADRRLAEKQQFCAVLPKNRLGSMGVPFAVTLKGRKVFLCCEGCKEDAEKEPEKTLAQVEKRKGK